MRCLLVLCLLGLAVADNLNADWEAFKTTYGKNYNQAEEVTRRLVWERAVRFVQKHNMEADLGKHTYWVGINEYADLTDEEYRNYMTGYRQGPPTTGGSTFMAPENIALPDTVDWRKKGYVTPIKNQGACGSCWAFSATGSLEGQHFKKAGKLVSLSEQNLVDCSTKEGNHGCGGGLMDYAFQYIKDNDGIDTEMSYPYVGRDQPCAYKPSGKGATDTGFTDVQSGSEDDLQKAVATVGPISVAIDASHMSFRMYKHGVYNEPACSSTMLDHGVLAVGYGTDSGDKYWLVKNSWGTTWGNKGYIMMSRDKNNQCGIATKASYPLV